mmetsp:Transcript_23114/g.38026  ORF Transcript_23114/g.38026 Transcript_23114/m.38026 type:complete len:85 (-) Transcript_23114:175-429(-)
MSVDRLLLRGVNRAFPAGTSFPLGIRSNVEVIKLDQAMNLGRLDRSASTPQMENCQITPSPPRTPFPSSHSRIAAATENKQSDI